jgi:hypothetical protein
MWLWRKNRIEVLFPADYDETVKAAVLLFGDEEA